MKVSMVTAGKKQKKRACPTAGQALFLHDHFFMGAWNSTFPKQALPLFLQFGFTVSPAALAITAAALPGKGALHMADNSHRRPGDHRRHQKIHHILHLAPPLPVFHPFGQSPVLPFSAQPQKAAHLIDQQGDDIGRPNLPAHGKQGPFGAAKLSPHGGHRRHAGNIQ